MSAIIPPPIVQLAFGLGNLSSAQWLAIQRLANEACQAELPRRIFKMFARKGVISSISRTAVMATIAAMALTAFEPSMALAGSAPAGKGLSAVAAGTSGA